MTTERLLLLGGTGEATELARAAAARFGDALEVTTSLAGRTERPRPVAGLIRIGGFGGPAGLAAYLTEHGIGRLIDATHPFATRISAAARAACEQANVPRLVLRRPPWRRHPRDRWIEVDVSRPRRRDRRSHGSARLAHHRCGRDCRVSVPRPQSTIWYASSTRPAIPCRCAPTRLLSGRGPFSVAEEHSLIERLAIDVLVCKASGGGATEAKIIAARERDLPVIMVRRPPPEPGEAVNTVEAALDWLARSCRLSGARRVS